MGRVLLGLSFSDWNRRGCCADSPIVLKTKRFVSRSLKRIFNIASLLARPTGRYTYVMSAAAKRFPVSPAGTKLIEAALALPEAERRHVAERLLASVPREPESSIREAWDAEAMARAEALEKGGVAAMDGDVALAALEKQLRLSHSR